MPMSPPPPPAPVASVEDLHPDILSLILCRLDGPSLATTSCATALLRHQASDPAFWNRLCLSSFPSLRFLPSLDNHRSLLSDASTFPDPALPSSCGPTPNSLISAVDLRYKGELVFSRVVEAETRTPWFLGSPFQVDALHRKAPPSDQPSSTRREEAAGFSPDEFYLDWVLIDPDTNRAVNLSSRRPVRIDRHWHTGEVRVKFATVIRRESVVVVTVVCGTEGMAASEVSLAVEDLDEVCLNGKDSLVILQSMLEGGRRRRRADEEAEEAGKRYAEFERRKVERKERSVRREARMDMFSVAIGVFLFLASIWFMAVR